VKLSHGEDEDEKLIDDDAPVSDSARPRTVSDFSMEDIEL